jgi:lipoyl(octanoyl) transferase
MATVTVTAARTACEVAWLGRMGYRDACAFQDSRVVERLEGRAPDALFLLEHPPVITLGRRGSRRDIVAPPAVLEARGIEIAESPRGGQLTYHGPGQLVGYPIVDLRPDRWGARRYVDRLEEVLIRTVAAFGIVARRVAGRTGVWVGDDKIAAIGIRITRGVTSHGFALNVNTDLSTFDLFVPCGIRDGGVTSIARVSGGDVRVSEVVPALVEEFGRIYERRMIWATARPDRSAR